MKWIYPDLNLNQKLKTQKICFVADVTTFIFVVIPPSNTIWVKRYPRSKFRTFCGPMSGHEKIELLIPVELGRDKPSTRRGIARGLIKMKFHQKFPYNYRDILRILILCMVVLSFSSKFQYFQYFHVY